jgi:hypothetical protein
MVQRMVWRISLLETRIVDSGALQRIRFKGALSVRRSNLMLLGSNDAWGNPIHSSIYEKISAGKK